MLLLGILNYFLEKCCRIKEYNKKKKESHLYYLPDNKLEQNNIYGKYPDVKKRLFTQINNIGVSNKK